MAIGEFPYLPLWTPLPTLITQREYFIQAMNNARTEIRQMTEKDKNVDSTLRDEFIVSQLGFYMSFRWSNHLNVPLSSGLWGGFISLQQIHEMSATNGSLTPQFTTKDSYDIHWKRRTYSRYRPAIIKI
jgi:hypothetical protein